jgi:CRISPR-associated protein Csb1
MTTFTKQLENTQHLLMKADLTPAQGDRFQPTGFPDIGAAEYLLSDGTHMLLVESAQSMANRLETVIWNDTLQDVVPTLKGLPYVEADLPDNKHTTSLQEAHRLNSPYFFISEDKTKKSVFEEMIEKETKYKAGEPVDRTAFVRFLYAHDVNALLHGVFVVQKTAKTNTIFAGRLRLARALSSFIEARDSSVASSGGVKNDRVDPSGNTHNGFGNVPFHRTEYTAASITAYFNLDLAQLRGYNLGDTAFDLLVALALYKIRLLLNSGLRLRTACDFMAGDLTVTAPANFVVPSLSELETALPELIAASTASDLFAKPPVTHLMVPAEALAAKKKPAKEEETPEEPKTEQTSDSAEGE